MKKCVLMVVAAALMVTGHLLASDVVEPLKQDPKDEAIPSLMPADSDETPAFTAVPESNLVALLVLFGLAAVVLSRRRRFGGSVR
jgi:MYXO-CTERM domain-containing protein